MIVTAKHRIMLWIPCLLFIALVLGNLERARGGGMIYRVYSGGFVCSVLLFVAALLISRGERGPVVAGLALWIIAILSLLLTDRSTLLLIHLS
jgi:hypothetical protein